MGNDYARKSGGIFTKDDIKRRNKKKVNEEEN
jgi:hypothetical protein